MDKYLFISKDESSNTKITYRVDPAEDLTSTDLLQAFVYFMKAVSYNDSSIRTALEIVIAELPNDKRILYHAPNDAGF